MGYWVLGQGNCISVCRCSKQTLTSTHIAPSFLGQNKALECKEAYIHKPEIEVNPANSNIVRTLNVIVFRYIIYITFS